MPALCRFGFTGAASMKPSRVLLRVQGVNDMVTKVQLFLNMKNEGVARPLGVRRLRRAPGCGQKFEIAVDGRSVRARITRFSSATKRLREVMVPDVYAEEI
jgi:hypothetical protein